MDNQEEVKPTKPAQGFNSALFLGCCAIAASILISGFIIAGRIPSSLHGNLHGSFSGTLTDGGSSNEFLSEWEAAGFLRIGNDELERIVQAGELDGAYAVFQVERRLWREVEFEPQVTTGHRNLTPAPPSVPLEYDIILEDQRVFSRERLAQWLHGRMDIQ